MKGCVAMAGKLYITVFIGEGGISEYNRSAFIQKFIHVLPLSIWRPAPLLPMKLLGAVL